MQKSVDNLRENILKTAESEFINYGIRGVSIDDLCEILHISKKTFYTEFRQKEEVIALVLERISESNKRADREYVSLLGKVNAIDFALSYRHPLLKERKKKHAKFMHDLIKYYPEIHNAFLDSKRDSIKNFIVGNIIKGVNEGLYRSELASVNADSDIVDILYDMMLVKVEGKEALFDTKVDIYLRSVCNEAGLKYYEQNNK